MITFYKKSDPYWQFGNMAAAPFRDTTTGKEWRTSEHYFQAQKFPTDPEYQERIRLTASPMIAKRLGSSRKHPLREDWNTYRLHAMKEALRYKFSQNEAFKALLLGTADSLLVEGSPRDSFWGCGPKKDGQNWLGKLLMEIRDEFRSS